jgi:hypothetical protein
MVVLSVLAAWSVRAAGCRASPRRLNEPSPRPASSVIAKWPDYSRLAAAKLIEEYGPADLVEPGRLVWGRRGSWARITVWETEPSGSGSGGLEETVAFPVPLGKRPALADFSDTVRASPDGAMLLARSASEELNCLKLNLAREIIDGKADPAQARAVYDRTLRLAASGKRSPLLRGLLFSPTAPRRSFWPVRFGVGHDPALRDPLWSNEPSS